MPPAEVARFLLPSNSRSELRRVRGPGAADMDSVITLLVDVALQVLKYTLVPFLFFIEGRRREQCGERVVVGRM